MAVCSLIVQDVVDILRRIRLDGQRVCARRPFCCNNVKQQFQYGIASTGRRTLGSDQSIGRPADTPIHHYISSMLADQTRILAAGQ